MTLDKDLASIQEVRNLVSEAKKAQKEFAKLDQNQVNEVVKTLANTLYSKAEYLAKMANEETGFGKWEDKIVKNQFASKTVYEYIKDMKTIGVIQEDKNKGVMEVATPVGVIAGLVPSTNPTATTIYKALISLKSGNAIIFSPHPSALKCILETVKLLNEGCEKLNLPKGLISCISIPTMEATNALMKHKDVSLIIATGGSAMVKAAYSSGTPALGVGPGNVPAFIEKSADIKNAVRRIIESKTFDNGVICASEQAVVVESTISEKVKKEFIGQGCYFVNEEEKAKLEKVIQKPNGSLNAGIVGKSAQAIGEMAGVQIPRGTKIILANESGVGMAYPFSKEKLSPLLAFYVEPNWEMACEKCIELLEYDGKGHSLSIHTENEEIIKAFALKKPVSRILVNTSSTHGGIGGTTNIAPALTLGCGAVGGSATSDNVSPLHLFNIRRVAYGVKEVEDLKESKNTCDIEKSIEEIVKKVLMELKNK